MDGIPKIVEQLYQLGYSIALETKCCGDEDFSLDNYSQEVEEMEKAIKQLADTTTAPGECAFTLSPVLACSISLTTSLQKLET